jgi:hypothetical protein
MSDQNHNGTAYVVVTVGARTERGGCVTSGSKKHLLRGFPLRASGIPSDCWAVDAGTRETSVFVALSEEQIHNRLYMAGLGATKSRSSSQQRR